jgi:hypothetical protein
MQWIVLALLSIVAAPDEVKRISGRGSYAVVVSRSTYTDAAWRPVVDALVARHRASIVIHPGDVRGALDALRDEFPRHACFVARPLEATRQYVISVNRLTRELDDDPYGDVRWGILTGYVAADALRIAKHDKPLVVRKFAAGCEFDLDLFEEGVEYSERDQGVMWRKTSGGEKEKTKCPADATSRLVSVLNEYRPDYFMTSGHATARDWQIGYRFQSGQFRSEDGRLYGLDRAGKRFDINSPNPKIYTSSGNCLMGLVDGKQAMALAWMHSAGVHQMVGYVVTTWYGFGGRCEKDFFLAQQGRYSLAESFFLQNQRLLHRLRTRFPKTARVDLDQLDIESGPDVLNALAHKHGLTDRDELGLLWDRDTVVLYGDPAWEARLAPQKKPQWDQKLTRRGKRYRFVITARLKGAWGIPPMAFLPFRVKDVTLKKGADLKPLITDDFILVPLKGPRTPGDEVVVEFTASPR